MTRQRSKFWTVFFSLLPGAGQMFMGFMKTGLSLMAPFFFIVFVSTWLNIGPLMFVVPIIWFYSFFDSIGRCFADPATFALLEDRYLLRLDALVHFDRGITGKARLIVGAVVIFIGAELLLKQIVGYAWNMLIPEVARALGWLADSLPQLIVGVAIIALGIFMIVGRKRRMDRDA